MHSETSKKKNAKANTDTGIYPLNLKKRVHCSDSNRPMKKTPPSSNTGVMFSKFSHINMVTSRFTAIEEG